MNYTLLFTVLSVIAIVSIIFSFSMSFYINMYDTDWYGLFSKNNLTELNKEKIFLLGSSTVYSVNSTIINHHFNTNGMNYEFYNLADMSDTPKKRIHSMTNIISNDPTIIIYGIDLANFRTEENTQISLDEIFLEPKKLFLYQSEDLMEPIRKKIPGSPKDRTLLTLKYFLFGPTPHHHPFINFYETSTTPTSELKQKFRSNTESQKLNLSESNQEIISLKEIMSKFKKNNIKLIIFTAPTLIQQVDGDEIKLFEQKLNDFAQEYDFSIYFLHDKYVKLEIWRDSQHVAINSDTTIYSEDILKILLKEMK